MHDTHVIITDNVYSPVRYDGLVSVIYLDKNGNPKSINKHNTGTDGLFTAVTRSLAGLSTGDYIPTKIMGYSDDSFTEEAFTQQIAYASKPITYKDNLQSSGADNNIVQYTFIVPLNNLVSRGTNIVGLRLLNDNNEVCAQLSLSETEAIKTNVSSNILIYWKLKFSNSASA